MASHSFLTTHVLRIEVIPNEEDPLDHVLRFFWNLELLGVPPQTNSALEEFPHNVQYRMGRYEVALPWKDAHPTLPDNFLLSKRRLNGLNKRLRQEPEVIKKYDSVIKGQLK